jgi:hypothetical protein
MTISSPRYQSSRRLFSITPIGKGSVYSMVTTPPYNGDRDGRRFAPLRGAGTSLSIRADHTILGWAPALRKGAFQRNLDFPLD